MADDDLAQGHAGFEAHVVQGAAHVLAQDQVADVLRVTGKAAPMLAANIDTDVIMPKQFLKGIDRNGPITSARFLAEATLLLRLASKPSVSA